MWRMILLLGSSWTLAATSTGASGQPTAARPGAGTTYMGVFWYDRARPTTTLRHQVYDIGKGEFDRAAVDRWLERLRVYHPDHGAYVREIRTDGEPGATEPERVAAALVREHQRWEAVNRRDNAATIPRFTFPPPDRASPARPGARPLDGGRGIPGAGGSSSVPSSPFPYPNRPRPP